MPQPPFPTTRREFLKGAATGIGLLAFGPVAPRFFTESVFAGQPAAEADRTILVLIQLGGGNDGLNTLVPYQDDNYYRLRPTIGLKRPNLLPIADHLALHSACAPLERLFKEGQLSIVQNVGYPNPNRSHFRSMEIWQTAAESSEYLSTGWLGRYFDNSCSGAPKDTPLGVNIGNELPDAFLNESDANVFSFSGSKRQRKYKPSLTTTPPSSAPSENASFLQHTMLNALVAEESVLAGIRNYRTSIEYPSSKLAQDLKNVAALIAAGQPTRAYFVSHPGFDTHADQLNRQTKLLKEFSAALAAFQADLIAHKLDKQVLTTTFSEFGRRPAENRSGGTDHGTAAPLFVMGAGLKSSLLGQAPNLDLEPKQDLAYSTDFRSVYATLIDDWLAGDSQQILGSPFPKLPLI